MRFCFFLSLVVFLVFFLFVFDLVVLGTMDTTPTFIISSHQYSCTFCHIEGMGSLGTTCGHDLHVCVHHLGIRRWPPESPFQRTTGGVYPF